MDTPGTRVKVHRGGRIMAQNQGKIITPAQPFKSEAENSHLQMSRNPLGGQSKLQRQRTQGGYGTPNGKHILATTPIGLKIKFGGQMTSNQQERTPQTWMLSQNHRRWKQMQIRGALRAQLQLRPRCVQRQHAAGTRVTVGYRRPPRDAGEPRRR